MNVARTGLHDRRYLLIHSSAGKHTNTNTQASVRARILGTRVSRKCDDDNDENVYNIMVYTYVYGTRAMRIYSIYRFMYEFIFASWVVRIYAWENTVIHSLYSMERETIFSTSNLI